MATTLRLRSGQALGSTVLETNTSGAMTADQQYYAYGRQRDTGPVVTDHKFTGQKLDATGLQYFNARYYDPEIGQFIGGPLGADTLVPDPSNLFDYNRYMYTRGNPMQYTDPTGHAGVSTVHDSNDGPPEPWQQWMHLYDTDVDQLQGEILVWLQDHQANYEQITLMHQTLTSYAEAMGGTAVLDAFENVFANSLIGGQLPDLGGNPAAQQLVNDILSPVAHASMAETLLNHQPIGSGVSAPCSFVADTPITTSRGDQPIAEITIGERVLAFDEALGVTSYYTVTALLRHVDPVLVTLVINGEVLVTTPEHPFYRTTAGWTPAGELLVGDEIRAAHGRVGTIQAITLVEHPQTMYNLTVAAAHTFFVGEQQWLVHNQCDFQALRRVGVQGNSRNTRIIAGDESDALKMFYNLSGDALIEAHPRIPGGLIAALDDGTVIGYRPYSKSGPPTIDVNHSTYKRTLEIKFQR